MDSTRNEFLRLWNKSARNFEANIPKTTSNSHTLRASICNSLATTYYTLSMKDEALDYATKAMVYVPRKTRRLTHPFCLMLHLSTTSMDCMTR